MSPDAARRVRPAAGHVWEQLRSYADALRWLARKLWDAFGWQVVRAVVAAQIGVVVAGAGLSLSVYYAQKLESNEPLRLGDLALNARDESTLGLMVAAVLLILLAGAGILFWAQRRIVSMAVQLNHRVRMDVAVAYGGELPEPTDWANDRAVWRSLWVLQTRDARRTAIVARNLLRGTVNVGIAAVGLAALLYLELQLTLLFLGVMVLALIAYYYANMASARATRRYEAVAPGPRKGLHRLVQSAQTLSQPRPDRQELEAALDRAAVAEETDAFRDRFGALIYAELLGFTIMGLALAGLIAYMGRAALAGDAAWTRLLAYLVVLRITLSGVRSLLGSFAFFSRFYPSIDRLNRFFAGSSSEPNTDPLEELPLQGTGAAELERDEVARPVAKGEAVEVRLPVALSRYSLGLLASIFAGDDVRRRRRMLGHIALAAPLSVPTTVRMRSLLMLEGDWDAAALRERLGEHAEEIERAVGLDPDATVTADAWAALSHEAAARLVLLAAQASERPVIAVDAEIARAAGVERLLRDLEKRIVLICGDRAPEVADELGVTRSIAVSQRGEVLAIGSPAWMAGRGVTVAEPDAEAPAGAWDDEELDEEA